MDSDSTRWLKLRSGSEIRGPQQQLTDECAQKLGYAFACWLAGRRGRTPDALVLAVGRDPRSSGARIKAAFTRGITAADSDVLDCGLCPAPALFKTVQPDCGNADGAIMVTASATDPNLNGFRFITADGGLKDTDVDEILRRASEAEVPERLVVPHDADGIYYESLRGAAARRSAVSGGRRAEAVAGHARGGGRQLQRGSGLRPLPGIHGCGNRGQPVPHRR